jgi:DNA-directed RNA polymerase subunit K/omega
MDYGMRKKLEQVSGSKYEAVIVAARIARRINQARLVAEEQAGADAPLKYPSKVTIEALNELASGKVKFKYREEVSASDELFTQ